MDKNKPVFGKEHAVLVTEVIEVREDVTYVETTEDLDMDGTNEIFIVGRHPGLNGLHVVVLSKERGYWSLVTE